MRLNYSFNKQRIAKEVEGQSPFILTNKKGGFYFGSPHDTFTKFNGLFFPFTTDVKTKEWDLYKTVEFIGVEQDATSMTNNFSTIKLKKPNASEEIYLNHSATLIYEVSKTDKPISLILDCKKIYDDSTKGRVYSISQEGDCHVIHYAKYKDDSLSEKEYDFYLAVKTNLAFETVDTWFERYYSLDKHRGDSCSKWVYKPLEFIANSKGKLVVAYSLSKDDAVSQAVKIFDSTVAMKKHKAKYVSTVTSHFSTKDKSDYFSYLAASTNFDSLVSTINEEVGIYAGLPWFFHYWARDEAISLIGLLKEEHYNTMKTILMRWLDSDSVRIPNRFPHADLGSADATGWMYFRLHQLLETLKEKGQLKEYFTQAELQSLYTGLLSRITSFLTSYMHGGLLYNKPLETWMDTGDNVGDVRADARIEIQALYVAMHNAAIYLAKLLGKKRSVSAQKEEFLAHIKDSFFKEGYLWDGSKDATIRPNIFIAAYVAPELLSKKEWESCFSIVLRKLIVTYDQGIGLSTIDTSHYLFKEWHSGQTNESYHRGDSWFWVNSMAAIVLNDISSKKFKKIISGLKNSAVHALLWDGAMGQLAEISSAKKLLSQGCFSQAWSYALLLELLHKKL